MVRTVPGLTHVLKPVCLAATFAPCPYHHKHQETPHYLMHNQSYLATRSHFNSLWRAAHWIPKAQYYKFEFFQPRFTPCFIILCQLCSSRNWNRKQGEVPTLIQKVMGVRVTSQQAQGREKGKGKEVSPLWWHILSTLICLPLPHPNLWRHPQTSL